MPDLDIPNERPKPKTPDIKTVKTAVGGTWFDIEEEADTIRLDTRDHGDVGEETPGKKDVEEGRRIAKALKTAFPTHEVGLEAVDEWVVVDIRKTPKDARKLAEEAKARMIKGRSETWAPRIAEILAELDREIFGGERPNNCACPLRWNKSVGITENGNTTIALNTEFGERFLYRDHPGAIPAFKTPEEARKAAEKILLKFGPGTKITGQRQTRAMERETYNYRPPNNIIQRTGTVIIDLEAPARP